MHTALVSFAFASAASGKRAYRAIGGADSRVVVSLLIAVFVIRIASSSRAASGDIYNLGMFNDSFGSFGYAVNSAGQVTGDSFISGITPRAFLTTGVTGVMTDLGVLGASTSRSESLGRGINASGQVVGQSNRQAFLYTGIPGSGGAMFGLGTLGGSTSWASGINAFGQIVGASETNGNTDYHAFLYAGKPGSGGVMMDLGTLGGRNSYAYDINASSQVVGHSWLADASRDHAFLYSGVPGERWINDRPGHPRRKSQLRIRHQ